MGRIKWTEKKIQQMQADGFGKGTRADYKPWLCVESTSSLGRARRVWSPKTGRTHHLLSDVEYTLFLALEWAQNVVDIREQYPLERECTLEIARSLGIRHPHYPGTTVPTVMSADFLVTKIVNGVKTLEAFNAKRDEEAEDEVSLLKLEIQRSYFEALSIAHHVIFHSQIPKQTISNIAWIRDACLKAGEHEPRPGFYSGLVGRMVSELNASPRNIALAAYCEDFDGRHGLAIGTGLRVARMLMHERILKPDLTRKDLAVTPVGQFILTGRHGHLRVMEVK